MTDLETSSEKASNLRRRAEEALRGKTASENLDAQSPVEIQRLLHELRVHQIELEMQNEELRRAQLQVDSERARYFDLYDLAPMGYFTISAQGLILEGNLTAAGLLRLARSELVHQPFSHFILKEDQDLYYLQRKELFETGQSRAYELRMVKKGGAQFWAQLAASAAQDADGAPVCRIVLSDMSERKQVEVALHEINERKRVEEALRASEKRYRSLVDSSPDATFYISRDMHVILCNQRAAGLYGVENPAEMLGMSAFNLFGPENHSWITEDMASFPRGWSVRGQEITLTRVDGSHFPAEVGASLVVNETDETIGMISVVRDITQRKLLEQYLLRSERLAAMGAVTAELAHEIKNPLQAILSNLELVLDFALDPHESQQQLRLCYHELERLVDLTNRLLNLAGPNQTVSRSFSVPELFQRILGLVDKSALAVGVSIDLVVPDDFPLILEELDPMIQVLLNLSINAIEAMPHGGQLTLSAEAAGETIRLNVINDGNISPSSRIENIFELFYTTKSGGSGLGLPISHNIVQKMGGSLSADNLHHPDRVKFTITLPASMTQRGPVQTHPLASVSERDANPGEQGNFS